MRRPQYPGAPMLVKVNVPPRVTAPVFVGIGGSCDGACELPRSDHSPVSGSPRGTGFSPEAWPPPPPLSFPEVAAVSSATPSSFALHAAPAKTGTHVSTTPLQILSPVRIALPLPERGRSVTKW